MKKLLVLLIVLTMLFALTACDPESAFTNIAQQDATEDTASFDTPLEKYFPADWDDRYVLNVIDGVSADVFCKSAYGTTPDNGWLFQVIAGDTFPDSLPASTMLGTHDGKVIYATYPSNIVEYEDSAVMEDYADMSGDISEILHQLIHALGGEHDHSDPLSAGSTESASTEASSGTYVTPEALGITNTYVGVFRLETSRWSEESKNELLHENNQNGFISIAPDGTAYLRCGNETTEGTVLIYSDPENVPNNMNQYKLTFDAKTYEANMFQSVLTVDDMPKYTDINDMQGTTWIFIHETDDWWTEATFADDIG